MWMIWPAIAGGHDTRDWATPVPAVTRAIKHALGQTLVRRNALM
jgi:hypothetical protein